MPLFSNPLERAMRRAARDPEQHQDAFYAALLRSTLWVPEPPTLATPEGKESTAVYTSRGAAAKRCAAGAAPRELKAAEALALGRGHGEVVLNPGGDLWYAFHESELEALCAGLIPGAPTLRGRAMPARQRLMLGALEENPLDFKRALSVALRELPTIERAYLTLAQHGHGRAAGPVLFLGFVMVAGLPQDEGALEEVVARLDPVIAQNLPQGASIEVAPLADLELVAACEAIGPPFYRRSAAAPGDAAP